LIRSWFSLSNPIEKQKNTILSEQFCNPIEKQKIPHCQEQFCNPIEKQKILYWIAELF
jgi:hypothetical protein